MRELFKHLTDKIMTMMFKSLCAEISFISITIERVFITLI